MNFQKYEPLATKIFRVSFGALLIPFLIVNLILPFIYFFKHYILVITLLEYLATGLFLLVVFIVGLLFLDKKIGKFLYMLGIYYAGEEIWEEVTSSNFLGFELASTLWYPLVILGLAVISIIFIILINSAIQYLKKQKGISLRQWAAQFSFRNYIPQNRKVVIATFLIGITGISAILFSTGAIHHQVDIQPQDYEMQFRIWANVNPRWYTEEEPNGLQMLEQMDNHSVIIQNFLIPIGDENGTMESFSPTINTRHAGYIIGNLTWFETNYPNIGFHFYAFGLGYESNGNYEGSIYTAPMLKRFVDVYRTTNLTNVKGIYTDWEGPNRKAPPVNLTRNAYHQALWTDAMAYTRSYFPNWTFSCCYPSEMVWDPADEDYDMEYFKRYNVFHPVWDEYAPMVYRDCNLEKPDGSTSESSWYVYAHANALVNGLFDGDASMASFWIGCTGCGPYRNDALAYERGALIDFGESTGFDAYARDILILKHFGIPTVSVFHGIETHEVDQRINGFFYEYGLNAFDRLNATVNGPAAQNAFQIATDSDFNFKRHITADFMLNYNRYGYLLLYICQLALGFGLLKKNLHRINQLLAKKYKAENGLD